MMTLRQLALTTAIALTLTACGGSGGGSTSGDAGGGSVPVATSITGTITPIPNTVMDSDTNDPESPATPNNAHETAQMIPNPALVNGWVNADPAGVGRFAASGDLYDTYMVSLGAGENVVLTISDWASNANDLELYLFRAAEGTLADSSEGVGETETVTAPADGIYHVLVAASTGGSPYIMAAGNSGLISAISASYRQSADFVPGDVVVQLRDTMLPAGVSGTQFLQGMGLVEKAGAVGRTRLMTLGTGSSKSIGIQALGIDSDPLLFADRVTTPAELEKRRTIRAIKALHQRPEVLSADPNYIFKAQAVPMDPLYAGQQWHYEAVNLPAAWDVTTGTPASGDVVVAVVDTGVMMSHPDLQNALLPDGYDFISDPISARDGDGIDADPDDPGDNGILEFASWHGTHVAGTVAADSNNGIGVAGVSWGAKILPIRVLGQDGATSYDIQQGLLYASGQANDSGMTPAQSADIINLSLGCGNCYSAADEAAFRALADSGVLVVAAAGNNGLPMPFYPASYDGVISVGATDINNERARYSNYHATVDVVAPGGWMGNGDTNLDGYNDGVLSTYVDGSSGSRVPSYDVLQGTSMATPEMSGVLALMRALDSSIDYHDVMALLAAGDITADLGPAGHDVEYGYGLIDAAAAVNRVASGGAIPSRLVTYPGHIVMHPGLTQVTFDLQQEGGAPISGAGFQINTSRLALTPVSIDPDGKGTWQIEMDRSSLPYGVYEYSIRVDADNGTRTVIPVTVHVGATVPGDTGRLYVVLLDETKTPVDFVGVNLADDHTYSYSFSSVTAGNTYYVAASSDTDWDDLICEPGEACGGYASGGSLEPIVAVDGAAVTADFSTVFITDPAAAPTAAAVTSKW